MQSPPLHGARSRPAYTVLLIAAVISQLALTYFFNTDISYYVADDLCAVELAHHVSFWNYVQTPVDVHWVPLHRATNYLIHHLLPMNFAAATLFMLLCHALTLLFLYRLLQQLHAQPLNRWLVAAYALNAFVPIPLHWWSAGLHRFPYVLASVVSCYGFVRFVQDGRFRFAVLALFAGLIATGFYIKGILIPLYWLAILFCVMDFRDWRKNLRPLAAVAIGGLLSLAYVGWYLLSNTHTLIELGDASTTVTVGTLMGISITAQMLLQMVFRLEYGFWINLAWTAVKVSGAWRAIFAGLVLVMLNILMISASVRSSSIGPLIMLAPRYYYDVLFLIVIFASLICRNLRAIPAIQEWSARQKNAAWRSQAKWLLAVAVIAIYAATGWRTTLFYTNPGAYENHWLAARYERNLMATIADAKDINLVDAPLPDFFLYEVIEHKPLMLSTWLAWHGLHPPFGKGDKPLLYVDRQGNLHPATQ
jgi:hypothetical protein